MQCQVLLPTDLCLERLVARIVRSGKLPEDCELLYGLALLDSCLLVLQIFNYDIRKDPGHELVEFTQLRHDVFGVNFIVQDGPQILYDLFAVSMSILLSLIALVGLLQKM